MQDATNKHIRDNWEFYNSCLSEVTGSIKDTQEEEQENQKPNTTLLKKILGLKVIKGGKS